MNDKKALVIFSGGQDSTTCLGVTLKNYKEVEAITFIYGQKHSIEVEQAKKICGKLNVKQHVIDISFFGQIVDSALTSNGDVNQKHSRLTDLPASFVPNRNQMFITIAHALAQKIGAEVLVTGVCDTDYCLPGSTDILTKNGIISLSNLKEGDEVYSFNPKTNLLEFKPVVNHFESPSQKKKLLRISFKNGVVFDCTDNHHMVKVNCKRKDREVVDKKLVIVEAKELKIGDFVPAPVYTGTKDISNNSLGELVDLSLKVESSALSHADFNVTGEHLFFKSTNKIKRFVTKETYIKVLCWYITEGYSPCYKEEVTENNGKNRYKGSISQSKSKNPNNWLEVKNILESIFVDKTFSKDSFEMSGALISVMRQQGGSYSENKHIPEDLMNSDLVCKKMILETLILGDGHVDKKGYLSYYTTSLKLAHQVNQLCIELGKKCYVSKRKEKNENCSPTYHINISSTGNDSLKQRLMFGDSYLLTVKKIEEIDCYDKLYELTILDNHTLIAGQQGLIICSQSGYPDCREVFIKALETTTNLGSGCKIKIETPLMRLDKAETFELAKTYGCLDLVIEDSITCYNGNREIRHDWGYGCNECPSCKLRARGWEQYKDKERVVCNG